MCFDHHSCLVRSSLSKCHKYDNGHHNDGGYHDGDYYDVCRHYDVGGYYKEKQEDKYHSMYISYHEADKILREQYLACISEAKGYKMLILADFFHL